MRVVLMSFVSTAILLIAGWPAQADDVPDLNVDPVCRGIAQQAKDPSESGGTGFGVCSVRQERASDATKTRQ
jgi:hypothetical protein